MSLVSSLYSGRISLMMAIICRYKILVSLLRTDRNEVMVVLKVDFLLVVVDR